MAEAEEVEAPQDPAAVKARLQAARDRLAAAGRDHGHTTRRADEHRLRKGRVNPNLLSGKPQAPPLREETWTIRCRLDLKNEITALSKKLTAPRARVTIADIMEKAMLMVIDHLKNGGSLEDDVPRKGAENA